MKTDCRQREVNEYSLCNLLVKDAGKLSVFLFFFIICIAAGGSEAFANPLACGNAYTAGIIPVGGGVNPVCQVFVYVNSMMEGLTGKAICTIAVMAVGAAALFGKISWPIALITALGVALVFGAGSFIAQPGLFSGVNNTADGQADPIGAVFSMLATAMNGNTARMVAIACCIVLGIGALFGKITWLQALLWVAGVGMVIGAGQIITDIQGQIDGPDINFLAAAVGDDPIGLPMMQIINLFLSTTGVTIGTVAVMACGFAALIGKLSWPRAMMLGAGIALLFGAVDVVYILFGPLTACDLTLNGATAGADDFTIVLCGFMDELQGPVGQTIGTLAVMILGILAVMGKISWEMGFVVVTGIALVFGANAIINIFEPDILGGVSCGGAGAIVVPNTGNAIADVLCYIMLILYGPAGKSLATIAVTMMGFGALMGKVSFSQAFVVAVGIAVTFGAPTLVTKLLPGAAATTCQLNGQGGGGPDC